MTVSRAAQPPWFPIPFAGIKYAVEAPVSLAVAALLECGHHHNFAVELDHSPPRIYTTTMGAECIRKRQEEVT